MPTQDQEFALERKFDLLLGERIGDGEYRLRGLPAGRNFRRESSYETINAGWLKINDVAFAAESFELGEYEQSVTVKQIAAGGGTYIEL